MNKRLLSAVVSGAVLALAIPAASFADTPAPGSFTAVSGVVTHNGNPVSGATVTVTCGTNVLSDTTGVDGTYEVDYSPQTLCPAGATANVTATSGDLSGSHTGPVTSQVADTFNVALVDVSVVPEMGVLAGTAAVAIGGGAFVAMRQRKLSNLS